MEKYVYPMVLFTNKEGQGYTVLYPDLDIVTSGDTVEEAYLRATEYLQSFLEIAKKFESTVSDASTYDEAKGLNPKRIVLLSDAEIDSANLVLTAKEKKYNNFMKKFLYED